MPRLEIIDTFPAFEALWAQASHRPIEDQVDAWEREYMSQWPELLQLQLADYTSGEMSWRTVARERVFPALPGRLPAMRAAHDFLRTFGPDVFALACSTLELEMDVVFVLYVGIGCGAGWAASYGGKSAVLFGLENIAEEGWAFAEALRGLAAHEVGHLAHARWLAEAGLAPGEGAWWQLFEEGLAQRCEHTILGTETWHMALGDGVRGWLAWCRENQAWLANEYLRAIEEDWPVKEFFGSWFDIRGYKQTGYYLGHEVVRRIQENRTLREIACLPDLPQQVKAALEALHAEK